MRRLITKFFLFLALFNVVIFSSHYVSAQSSAKNQNNSQPKINKNIGLLDRLACINSANRGVFILSASEEVVRGWGVSLSEGDGITKTKSGIWLCRGLDNAACQKTVKLDGELLERRVWIPLAGSCTVCDALYLLLVGVEWIFGIIGFVVMLIMAWSAFQMISSAGDSGKYQAGQSGVLGAATGIIVMLGSYQIVNLALYAMLNGKASLSGKTPEIQIQSATGPISAKWMIFCDDKTQIRDSSSILGE